MTTEEKCAAILKNIVQRCNEEAADYDGANGMNGGKPVIKFAADWGGNSLTLYIGDNHTHVGSPSEDYPFEGLIDQLYAQLIEGTGLSFQIPINPDGSIG